MEKQFKNSTDILPSALDMYLIPQVHPYNIILDYAQHIRSLRHVATKSFCVYWFVSDVVHNLLFVLRPCNELLLIFLLGAWIYRLVMLWTTAIHQVFLELPRLSKVTVRCLLHDFLQTGFGFWCGFSLLQGLLGSSNAVLSREAPSKHLKTSGLFATQEEDWPCIWCSTSARQKTQNVPEWGVQRCQNQALVEWALINAFSFRWRCEVRKVGAARKPRRQTFQALARP